MKIIQSEWLRSNGQIGFLCEEASSLSEFIFKVRRAMLSSDTIFIYDDKDNLETRIELSRDDNNGAIQMTVYRKLCELSLN